MADVAWPAILRPANGGTPEPSFANVKGPASAKGRSQVIASDAGFWTVRWAAVPLYTPEQWRAYSATRVLLNGQANRCEIPIFVLGIQVWPTAWKRRHKPPRRGVDGPLLRFTNSAAVEVGDMVTSIRSRRGVTKIEAGMYFSREGRLYVIQRIVSREPTQDDYTYAIEFWPPAREPIAIDATLEFDKPTLWARLQSDDEMMAGVDPAYQGTFDVNWVEDV